MRYTPRGSAKTLVDAMLAEPSRVWITSELAALIGLKPAHIHAVLLAAVNYKLVYKRRVNERRVEYRATPFAERSIIEFDDPRIRRMVPWTLPRMQCVRPTAGMAL